MAKLLVKNGLVRIYDEAGSGIDLSPAEAKDLISSGASVRPESEEEFTSRMKEEHFDAPVKALALGAARGATVGLSDVVLRETGAMSPSELAGYREYNPAASMGGEIGGAVLSTMLPGGPLGLAGRAATRGAAGLGKLGSAAAGAATEGALIGAGGGISSMAMDQGDIGGVLTGAATGAAFGGALSAGGGLAVRGAGKLKGKLSEKLGGFGKLEKQRKAAQLEVEAIESASPELYANRASLEERLAAVGSEKRAINEQLGEIYAHNSALKSAKAGKKLDAESIKEELARIGAASPKDLKGLKRDQLLKMLPDEIKNKYRGKVNLEDIVVTDIKPSGKLFYELKQGKNAIKEINEQIKANEAKIVPLQARLKQITYKKGGLEDIESQMRRADHAISEHGRKLQAAARSLEKMEQAQGPLQKIFSELASNQARAVVGYAAGGIPGAIVASFAAPVIKAAGGAIAKGAKKVAPASAKAASVAGRATPVASSAAAVSLLRDDELEQFREDLHAVTPEHAEIFARQALDPTLPPDVQEQAVASTVNSIQYLKDALAPPALRDIPSDTPKKRPLFEERATVSKRMAYVEDPELALKEFKEGRGTNEGVKYMEMVTPEILIKEREALRIAMIKQEAEGKVLAKKVAQQVALLLKKPADELEDPRTIAMLQQIYAGRGASERGNGSVRVAPKNLDKSRLTQYQRLLS